jgi:thiol-disulfide isomerase/thioredoxin
VNVRFAGVLSVKTIVAMRYALAIVCLLVLPLRVCANAAELRPWTGDWTGAPAVSLPGIEAARGHIVLVHFFATWCAPCRGEMPSLDRLVARSAGKLRVVGIAEADTDLRLRRFAATTPIDFPVLLDGDHAVAAAWNVANIPTTIVLDAGLNPRLVVRTDFPWDRIDPGTLAAMLAAGKAGAARY